MIAFVHQLAAEAPTVTSSHTNMPLVVVLALIGVLPGVLAVWVSIQTRRDNRSHSKVEERKDLTQLGADILEKEINRLTAEREMWEKERARWMDDRDKLMEKLAHVTTQLNRTNDYLVEVLGLLRKHKIDPPRPPASLDLGGKRSSRRGDVDVIRDEMSAAKTLAATERRTE